MWIALTIFIVGSVLWVSFLFAINHKKRRNRVSDYDIANFNYWAEEIELWNEENIIPTHNWKKEGF